MRTLILLLGLLLNSIVIDAQRISGSLVDEKGNPVSFANVVPLAARAAPAKSAVTALSRRILRMMSRTAGSHEPPVSAAQMSRRATATEPTSRSAVKSAAVSSDRTVKSMAVRRPDISSGVFVIPDVCSSGVLPLRQACRRGSGSGRAAPDRGV